MIDKAGDIIVQKTMDGCQRTCIPEFAYGKAYTAVSMQTSSRQFRDQHSGDSVFLINNTGGRMNPMPGGVVMKTDGQVVGAVGVSGAAADEDEYCALCGILESGIDVITEPTQHQCKTHIDGSVSMQTEDYTVQVFKDEDAAK